MASASFNSSLASGGLDGAALGTLHSVLGRVSRLKLRRFSGVGVGLDREATLRFLNLAFAVTGMTFPQRPVVRTSMNVLLSLTCVTVPPCGADFCRASLLSSRFCFGVQ